MRQSFRKRLQQCLSAEEYESVIKALLTLSGQMGNNLLMNNALLYYPFWQELQALNQQISPPPVHKRQTLARQLQQGLW